MRILTEPKNAIVKQYQKFLALDKVELVMTPEALDAAAEEALKLKTGARGLRTVIEEILLDVMYEIPSRNDVKKCVINAETIRNRKKSAAGQFRRPVRWTISPWKAVRRSIWRGGGRWIEQPPRRT